MLSIEKGNLVEEWAAYKFQIPKSTRPGPDGGQLLETVRHVVHLPAARRILEDGCLRGGLIYDESKLRKSRICVTWLSANTWAYGSIYGNVQFSFPWREQIRGRHCYWVEAMTAYSPHAYRLLFTERNLSKSQYVRKYDPTSDKGPLRERDGKWYWNSNYTSEFMVEGDVGLNQCTALDFIDHHAGICRLNGALCPDAKTSPLNTGGRVVASLLGHGLHTLDHVLGKPSIFNPARQLSHSVDTGVDGNLHGLGRKKDRFGGKVKSLDSRRAVLRGALVLYGHGKTASARELVALLSSPDVFEQALAESVNDHFEINGWSIPD